MQPKSASLSRVEHDYRIFFIFMTLVMLGMSVTTLTANQALRSSWLVIPFVLLMAIHILAHWNVNRIIKVKRLVLWYILGQGLLVFILVQLAGNVGMLFALYMAIIGESFGFLQANRWGFLAVAFYLSLSMINFFLSADAQNAGLWLLTTIPTVVFVGMFVTLYNRQAAAREQAQALAVELEAANRQLSEYSARVEDLSIANERQRMARELHDTLSQGLAGLILQLEAVDAHLGSHRPEKAQAIVANAMLNARSTLADARRVIDDLRQQGFPGQLQELLQLEISRFETATGIPCEFQFTLVDPIPDSIKEIAIRVVAEALTNIARHSQAVHAWLQVDGSQQTLSLSIRDDGQGFDPDHIPSGHYGLLGLRERVRLCNGEFNLESALDQGTHLSIRLPLLYE